MSTDVRAIIADRIRLAYSMGGPAEAHATNLLVALAANGVEVITDLPEVEVDPPGVVQSGETWTPRGRPAPDVRRVALEWLAIARYLEAAENRAAS